MPGTRNVRLRPGLKPDAMSGKGRMMFLGLICFVSGLDLGKTQITTGETL
jgi:hypothetical protein